MPNRPLHRLLDSSREGGSHVERALIIRGRVERAGTVTNLIADHLQRLPLATNTTSRHFR